jgi:hypothetical protein
VERNSLRAESSLIKAIKEDKVQKFSDPMQQEEIPILEVLGETPNSKQDFYLINSLEVLEE